MTTTASRTTSLSAEPDCQCPAWCTENGDHCVDRDVPEAAFYMHRGYVVDDEAVQISVYRVRSWSGAPPEPGERQSGVAVYVEDEITPNQARLLAQYLLRAAEMAESDSA